jgi:hypothetical protein
VLGNQKLADTNKAAAPGQERSRLGGTAPPCRLVTWPRCSRSRAERGKVTAIASRSAHGRCRCWQSCYLVIVVRFSPECLLIAYTLPLPIQSHDMFREGGRIIRLFKSLHFPKATSTTESSG